MQTSTQNISNMSFPSSKTGIGLNRFDNILKSIEDQREYRGLKLENEMRVLLISDPTTDKSAACLCVEVRS